VGLQLINKSLWIAFNHRHALQEIRISKGLQCNGTPTYDAFAHYSPAPSLYFDNRTTAELSASPADLDARFESLSRRHRLRLLFFGRLHAIKGVHHLIPLACALGKQGTDFELGIAGGGPLRDSVKAEIVEYGLQDQVKLLGTFDFEHELMPLLRHKVDLFVCPHLQGDPSCTYLETLCAGVPIVGYANEAWRALERLSAAGRLCPTARPQALAIMIAELSADRESLRQLADSALAFATQRVFEAEFGRRIEHI